MRKDNSIILDEEDIDGLHTIGETLLSLHPGPRGDSSWSVEVETAEEGKFVVVECFDEWDYSSGSLDMIPHRKIHAHFEDEKLAKSYVKLLYFLEDFNYQ